MSSRITDKEVEALFSNTDPKKKTLTESLGQQGAGRLIAKKLSCGSVAYRFKYYRDRKTPVEITIGRYQEKRLKSKAGITTAEARRKAVFYSQQKQQGIDPQEYIEEQKAEAERARRKAEAEARRGTFRQLLDVYVEDMKKNKKRSCESVEADLHRYVVKPFPHLMKAHARDIEPEDITDILRRMAARDLKATINRVRSYLHRAFKVGAQAHLDPVMQASDDAVNFELKHNPVSIVPRKTEYERALDRHLSEDEILRFWNSMHKYMALHTVNLFRLMFALGGQRPKETLSASWECYDLEERLLILPPELTKNKREHIVPLNNLAMEILNEQRIVAGHCKYPFPLMCGSGFVVDKHMRLDSLNTSVRRYIEGEQIEHFTPRDIRRTCKTLMGKIQISKEIRDRIHNHALNDVSSRHYDRYDYIPEKTEALKSWDLFIRSIIEPGRNVVVLARHAG